MILPVTHTLPWKPHFEIKCKEQFWYFKKEWGAKRNTPELVDGEVCTKEKKSSTFVNVDGIPMSSSLRFGDELAKACGGDEARPF